MAKDSKGNDVQFGDYVMVGGEAIYRIVKISETTKGIVAVGACVDLVGNGRLAKEPVDIAAGVLVMKSDGTVVS